MLLSNLVNTHQQKANKNNNWIELYQNDGASLRLKSDRKRITQVLNNLLSNAVKFGRPFSMIRINYEYCESNNKLTITMKY